MMTVHKSDHNLDTQFVRVTVQKLLQKGLIMTLEEKDAANDFRCRTIHCQSVACNQCWEEWMEKECAERVGEGGRRGREG